MAPPNHDLSNSDSPAAEGRILQSDWSDRRPTQAAEPRLLENSRKSDHLAAVRDEATRGP